MPHVDIHYRVLLGAGHHRQPRNPQPWVEPFGGSAYDPIPGTPIVENAFPQISFVPPGGTTAASANFAFWSRNSTSLGTTQTATHFSEVAGSENITLIAWYYLPGGGDGHGTAEWIDAYSTSLGTLVNDDFVTVASDPALTHEANAGGDVPTAAAEEVDALPTIASTSEAFVQWVFLVPGGSASGVDLSLPAGTGGAALATYGHRAISIPKPNQPPAQAVIILDGIINDAPGHILVNGHPVPVDPGWGSLVKQLFTLTGLQHSARTLSPDGHSRFQQVTAQEIGDVGKNISAFAAKGIAAKAGH